MINNIKLNNHCLYNIKIYIYIYNMDEYERIICFRIKLYIILNRHIEEKKIDTYVKNKYQNLTWFNEIY